MLEPGSRVMALPLDPTTEPSVRFVMDLGKALHRYGTPAHRLEEVMTAVGAQLGLTARIVSTPTAIYASFGPPESLNATLIRVDPGEVDLDKLARLDALTGDVLAGRTSPSAGDAAIAEILVAPVAYGPWISILCFGIASATGAQLFGGGLREMAVSGILGLGIGALAQLATLLPGLSRCFELVSAFAAAALALVAARVIGPYATGVASLAALVFLLPGLTLAVAMIELATRNLVSGTSRLTGAMMVLLQLGVGVALGQRVDLLLPPVGPSTHPTLLPSWTMLPTLVAITVALAVLFRARLAHTGWILLAAVAAYGGARLGAVVLGPELGAFLGALALGIGSNLVARWTDRPSLITIVPGVMLLVPGAMGFHSVESLMAQDIVGGLASAVSAAVVLVGIAAGLLLANSFVTPRRIL